MNSIFFTRLPSLGLALMIGLASANTANAVSVMGWKNNVYGVAEVWGLYYNEPWTSSSHRVYIENAQEVTVEYTYEFNHSLLDMNGLRVADDTIERHGRIKTEARGGQPIWINSGRALNLYHEDDVMRDMRYELSCYTRLNVRGRFNNKNTNDTWQPRTINIGPFWYGRE